MDNLRSLYVSIARIEENVDSMRRTLESVVEDTGRCHEDHEGRLRDLEKAKNIIEGKVIAVSAVLAAIVGYLTSWFSAVTLR